MSSYKLISLLLICIGITSCNATKRLSKKYVNNSISLEKTACFGTCPQYILTINGKGEMQFNGKQFTKMDGIWTSQLKTQEIIELFGTLDNANLFSFENDYPSNYTDLPSSILIYKQNGKSKTIRIEGNHPVKLDEILKNIIARMDSAKWVNANSY